MSKYLIKTATGEFIEGGGYEPSIPDSSYSIITLAAPVNISTQKWDGSSVVNKTVTEIAEASRKIADEASYNPTTDYLINAIIDEFKAAGLLGTNQTSLLKIRIKARLKLLLRAKMGV